MNSSLRNGTSLHIPVSGALENLSAWTNERNRGSFIASFAICLKKSPPSPCASSPEGSRAKFAIFQRSCFQVALEIACRTNH